MPRLCRSRCWCSLGAEVTSLSALRGGGRFVGLPFLFFPFSPQGPRSGHCFVKMGDEVQGATPVFPSHNCNCRRWPNNRRILASPEIPICPVGYFGWQNSSKELRERWGGCGTVGGMGLGKMRHLSQIVPLCSDFSPVSYQFHTFFYTPHDVFLAISDSSPFPPNFLRLCGEFASSAAANADADACD